MRHAIPEKLIPVLDAILEERSYQIKKWGSVDEHPHEVPGWLMIMKKELDEAVDEWANKAGDEGALLEILQVVTVGIACLEQHGVVNRWLYEQLYP